MTGAWGQPYRPPAGGWPTTRRLALGDCSQHFRAADAARVTGLELISGGSNYTSATVIFLPAAGDQGRGAAAEATVRDGAVVALRLISGGSHYLAQPQVLIQGDGQGATARATIGGGVPLLLNRTLVSSGSEPEKQCDQQPAPARLLYNETPRFRADQPECPPAPGQLYSAGSRNYYEPGGLADLSVCAKTGFKAVQAWLYWQGCPPFFLQAGAGFAVRYLRASYRWVQQEFVNEQWQEWTATCTMTVNKFTGCVTRSNFSMSENLPGPPFACDPAKSPAQNLAWWFGFSTGMDNNSPVIHYTSLQPYPSVQSAAVLEMALNSGQEVDGWTDGGGHYRLLPWYPTGSERLTTPTHIALGVQFETETGGQWYPQSRMFMELTLEQPYTLLEAQHDLCELLALWPLDDDRLYPWRTDAYLSVAPLLSRDATFGSPAGPDFSSERQETCPYSGEVLGRSEYEVLGTLPDRAFSWEHKTYCYGPYESMGLAPVEDWQGAWAPGTLEPTDQPMPRGTTEWTDNATCRFLWPGAWMAYFGATSRLWAQKWVEARVRRPSHNFFRPCGPDRWLMDEPNSRCIIVADPVENGYDLLLGGDNPFVAGQRVVIFGGQLDRTAWTVQSVIGSWVRVTGRLAVPPQAMNPARAARVAVEHMGAGVIAPLRFPNAWPICGRLAFNAQADQGGSLLELEADCWLLEGEKVDFVAYEADHTERLVQSAVPLSPRQDSMRLFWTALAPAQLAGATHIKSSGAPHYRWNDDGSKGDFVIERWTGSIGSGDPNETSAPTATGQSAAATVRQLSPCKPTALWCSPNPESGLAGTAVEWPRLEEAREAGNFALVKIRQHMRDPLWDAPRAACNEFGAEHGTLAEDGGLGNEDDPVWDIIYYAHCPMVEARLAPPEGAPALPAGRTLPGASNPVNGQPNADFVGDGGWEANAPCRPAQPETPWGLRINQRQCALVQAQCRWRELYLEALQIREVEI